MTRAAPDRAPLGDGSDRNEVGGPEGTRTPDLRFRKALLYPAELPGRDGGGHSAKGRRVRRLLIVVGRGLAAVAAAALAACGDGSGIDRLAAGERGRVAQVRSGDVVVLRSGLVVRLAGLDMPQRDEPGATAALDDLRRLTLGQDIELYYGGARRDAHGRALAQARLVNGRRWVQCVLLRDGVARVRTYVDNRALTRPMLTCEAKARAARRGLWLSAYRVLLPSEIDDRASGFQIVEGRVARATTGGGGVYLDFDGAGGGFAVQIARRATSDFERTGLAPQNLAGRLVRVRGVIGGDGLMRVDHPEQVELLRDR